MVNLVHFTPYGREKKSLFPFARWVLTGAELVWRNNHPIDRWVRKHYQYRLAFQTTKLTNKPGTFIFNLSLILTPYMGALSQYLQGEELLDFCNWRERDVSRESFTIMMGLQNRISGSRRKKWRRCKLCLRVRQVFFSKLCGFVCWVLNRNISQGKSQMAFVFCFIWEGRDKVCKTCVIYDVGFNVLWRSIITK